MIQLKIKTEYTFGQTYAPIGKVIERLKSIGCTAAAIVDINSTWGHVRWFKECTAAGIQPILGIEIAVSDTDLTQRGWFLAANSEGLRELYRVISKAHQQPISSKKGKVPRLYTHDVINMSDNIIKFAGEILDGELLSQIGAYIDLNPSSLVLNAKKRAIANKYGLKLVSTSDNSYSSESDISLFELLSKGGVKSTPQHILDELDNQETAKLISDSCVGLELPISPMVRQEGDLEGLCRKGIVFRNMEDIWTQEYEDRLNYELELIRSKDFESYFIIVSDMVHYAKEHMLVGPSRGSAAGSLVCYLARITEIDPIPPKLYFERFIDVSRTDLPDIDLDFPDNKRHMVFDYMSKKYGTNNIAHIGTISVYRPKSALIQVCKALWIPSQATAAVKVAMIERSSADARASNCLGDTFKDTAPGRDFIRQYPNAVLASELEGHASHTGVHAAGLLVCNDEITNYCVVDANNIAHIEKGAAEELGLLKIDVLGLRTLGVLEDAKVDIDWYSLKFDDAKTFEVFNSGRLCGIFQFEGNALRSISQQITFESIVEIDAVTALARPGPFAGGVTGKYVARKKGEKYTPIHPIVEAHMSETYGLPVYQEQTLAIVREIGKFDWKETSMIRKAMSKRMGVEFFDKYWPKFRDGAGSQGIPEKEARITWELINAMGSWQMNKAHTFSYAVISYWTAYLKAHEPLEFAAANLRNAKDEESAIELLKEMVREGIQYVAFDLELSDKNWSAKNGKLYGGFLSLHGVGDVKADKLVAARNEGKLSSAQIETINKSKNVFDDIFPFHTKYPTHYADPSSIGIASPVVDIIDIDNIPHGHYRVFLAELIYKNIRNSNEEVNIKKRDGKIETGPLEYIDFRFRDDTGMIGGRISRFDFESIGRKLSEEVPVGAHLMIRAQFYNGIKYAFIKKWRVIG